MRSLKSQIVLLNNDSTTSQICFVCGSALKGLGLKIVDTITSFMQVPLPNKLCDFVGKDFCIVLSKFDEICKSCLNLIDEVDGLEQNLGSLKRKVIDLLQRKYNIKVNESYEETDEIIEEDANDIQNEVIFGLDSNSEDTYMQEEVQVSEEKCIEENIVTKVSDCTEFCEYCSSYVLASEYEEHVKWHKNSVNLSVFTEVIKNKTDNEQSNVYNIISSEDSVVKVEISGDFTSEFLCKFCSTSFILESDLNNHIEEEHTNVKENKDKNKKLEILNEPSSSEIVSGIIYSDNKYKCSRCNFTHEDITVVKNHLECHFSAKKELTCSICDVPFISITALSKHLAIHNKSEGPVVCHFCGKECHDNLHALYHRRNVHNITANEIKCGLCNKSMESHSELKQHILINHRGRKEYKCEDCNKTFTRHVQLENHKLYNHGNSECRYCEKHIDDAVKLRLHEHRHARSDMKKFECDQCNRSFKTPGGLKVHIVSHTGNYKFFCEFCGRGFMSNVILEEHKGVHTREERYVCDICGRKFVLYSTFHLHKQWHENPYPFPCHICSRKFRYRSERSNHVRRDHTGEMPHKCPYCEAAFYKSSSLKKHISSHTKKYPFNCETCKKGFDQKRALAKHMSKVHDDNTMLEAIPKQCQYKVALRPDEYPQVV